MTWRERWQQARANRRYVRTLVAGYDAEQRETRQRLRARVAPGESINLMTKRQWYVGLAVVVAAVLLHAAVPRYEWRASGEYDRGLIRVDRWTGQATLGFVDVRWGRWVSVDEYERDLAAKRQTAQRR